MLFFLFMGAPLAFVMDVIAISLSGLIGLAAVLNCRGEGCLPTGKTLLYGVLQFVFCVDIFSAVWIWREAKRRMVEERD
jgi:hypothetical protein